MTENVAGLDLSMTATGWTMGRGNDLDGAGTGVVKTKGTRDDRLEVIRDSLRMELETIAPVKLILIEGYLNHSKSAGITGMVHGAVRSMLIEYRYAYATMPPTCLKKYATGSGAASKTDMRVAAYKRAGIEFADDNECDSWWLWVAANDYLGQPVFDLPKVNREMIAKIKMETP